MGTAYSSSDIKPEELPGEAPLPLRDADTPGMSPYQNMWAVLHQDLAGRARMIMEHAASSIRDGAWQQAVAHNQRLADVLANLQAMQGIEYQMTGRQPFWAD